MKRTHKKRELVKAASFPVDSKGLRREASRQEEQETIPPVVNEVLRSPGRPLDVGTQAIMTSRFGHSFGRVRVHADAKASKSAQSVNAEAYTVGSSIVFNRGAYAPQSRRGRELLAHELSHVSLQESFSTRLPTQVAPPDHPSEKDAEAIASEIMRDDFSRQPRSVHSPQTLYRKEIEGGGATPGKGGGVDLIFIIRAPDDQFTADVTHYVKTVLHGHTYKEVDNLDDIFDYLALLKPKINAFETLEPGIKVRRIRIVAHGSTSGDVKMTPAGEDTRRWFKPEEVQRYAKSSLIQSTIAQVMAPGAVVEFWGCNIGTVPKATKAWAELFNTTFKATTETFKTGFDTYYRPADKGEEGEAFAGQKGKWVQVKKASEVDARSKGLQRHYKAWLLARYGEMVANGDVLPLKTEAEQLTHMRALFDRANGDLKHILIERKSDSTHIRPGDQPKWMKLWKTTALP